MAFHHFITELLSVACTLMIRLLPAWTSLLVTARSWSLRSLDFTMNGSYQLLRGSLAAGSETTRPVTKKQAWPRDFTSTRLSFRIGKKVEIRALVLPDTCGN